jgi:hypothetical protein
MASKALRLLDSSFSQISIPTIIRKMPAGFSALFFPKKVIHSLKITDFFPFLRMETTKQSNERFYFVVRLPSDLIPKRK